MDKINANKNLTHCWQYQKRLDLLESDCLADNLTQHDISLLRTRDFTFQPLNYKDKGIKATVNEFIFKYEWLEKMPQRTTHVFGAFYKEILVGVIAMATPNAFSKMLGDNTKDVEKLIARGATKSWTPKNTGSWLIMKSINWMRSNTQFRLFSAYADTEAKELGTIYQACNFHYVGKTSGGTMQLFDQDYPDKGWFSDREIRKPSTQRRLLKECGVKVEKSWLVDGKFKALLCPLDVQDLLKQKQKEYGLKCLKRLTPKKHKYVYILGATKHETKRLLTIFKDNNKTFNYPKER